MRTILDDYPDYTAELEEIRESGITKEILTKIINKHSGNSAKTRLLYDRYRTMDHAVPTQESRDTTQTEGKTLLTTR